jgi:acetone carboxylase, beta subunit
MTHTPRIMGIDAGGTMTDTFLIDEDGHFVVGKAQTTPQDESAGFMASARDAMNYWGLTCEAGFPTLRTGIFSGTAMLNRLLERKGRKVGIIVAAGMEDYLRLERGIQTYLGYSFGDRVHLVTHRHNEPLVPRERILGVRGRINVFGHDVIPLYEDEARDAAERLLDMGVENIVVNLPFSYKNPAHELRVRAICEEVMQHRNGPQVPVYLSSELYPMRQDFPRLNSTVMEAYAAEPSRDTLRSVQQRVEATGGRFELRVMASHGGTISMNAKELARTMVSGPIGGVVGARYLGERIGAKNLACSDIGGTSFDLSLIADGMVAIKQSPDIARFLLNMPMVQVDSVGSGTGSYVRISPIDNRIVVGPDSAGARIGLCWPDSGIDTVTITDCSVVLGYINPDFFLGGEIVLDRERAIEAVTKQVAEPLAIDVYDAAAGVIEIFEDSLRAELLSRILGKGYGPESFTLLSYGGGGPLHVAGYTDAVNFEDILIPAWAPGFSAFGCACADFEYRFDKQLDLPLLPDQDAATRGQIAAAVEAAWMELKARVAEDFAKSGVAREDIAYHPGVRMLYYGQLNPMEIRSPVQTITSAGDLDKLCDVFEAHYGHVYGLSARTPQFGYLIASVFVTGAAAVEKPELPTEPLVEAGALDDARKTVRRIYWARQWVDAVILDLDKVRAGAVIIGPAIVESPASTMVVPPGRSARLDEHRIFHLSTKGTVVSMQSAA